MASSLALKRIGSNLLSGPLRPLRMVVQPSRYFNTNAVREFENESHDDVSYRRSDRGVSSPFSEVFMPLSNRNSLSQILNMLDQFVDSPAASGLHRNWNAKETAEGLNLRVDMPGLGKEDVKVSLEQNTLVIKGQGKKELEDENNVRRYSSRIDLPEKLYKTDEIKAEMKNGVLKVFLPKIKEEERPDAFHVNVE